ncbi:DUF4837 family protein [Constantimarinum furrinae]|uniref:DUF4837 domain-containing protein n=1 Tax=Constantimarinum furrinae TaxID=2562285 RepID=A0A7G8PT24_9FLAO|nr:DUF4837 family protein [Constantimarinum furrinae]QNJ97490.1 hypothetical protein ALE3EI_0915 [Constantimarinum furrinae]
MKPFYLAILSVILLFSCEDNGKRDTSFLPESLGTTNSLQVIITNDLWNGAVGETIRDYFAAPVDGLPQEEPLFSMNQMPPSTYTDFARKYRTFLHVTLGNEDNVSIKKNSYAKPQIGAFITARSKESLIKLISENHKEIISAFKASEIQENQKRIKISLKNLDSLEMEFGLSLKVPSAYRIAHGNSDFYWIRKDLKSGSTNILVYEVPLSLITNDSTAVGEIIKIRDSIGGSYLPVEDDDRFITEAAYAPYLFTTEIDGKFAYETKGIWEVKDQYMAGPFLNYAVKDTANDRYLILEGFTYAPSVAKRDLQFELESILKSAKIK